MAGLREVVSFFMSVLVVSGLVSDVLAYETGAPFSECEGMTPGHGSQQSSSSPYSITVSSGTYSDGASVTVTITGTTYSGLMMQARRKNSANLSPVGTWTATPVNTQIMSCTDPDTTITHTSVTNKQGTDTYTWVGPATNAGPIQFVATVAESKLVWWVNIKSATLTPTGYPVTTPDPNATDSPEDPCGAAPSLDSHVSLMVLLATVCLYLIHK